MNTGAWIFSKDDFLLVYTQWIAAFQNIQTKNCPEKRHIGQSQTKCETWSFWLPLPRASRTGLFFQHLCAGSEHLQTLELTPVSMSGVLTGDPLPRHN